jgi:hypothetical protein
MSLEIAPHRIPTKSATAPGAATTASLLNGVVNKRVLILRTLPAAAYRTMLRFGVLFLIQLFAPGDVEDAFGRG